MKRSELRQIILSELITEKFASPIIAGINKRIAGGRSNSTQLWNSTANSYGIAWDKVKDEHVSRGTDGGSNTLSIFFVDKGTENPYGDFVSYWDETKGRSASSPRKFWRDGLLGITIGKKVIGFDSDWRWVRGTSGDERKKKMKTRVKVNKEPKNYDKVGIGVDEKVWNFKRMKEIATEVFSIDISAVQNWNRELQSLRSAQKDGALAMKASSDILQDNKKRYAIALKAIKDSGVEGKELDIVMAHLEDSEKILATQLKQKIKDTRKQIVYPGWDNPFDLAVSLHRDMVKKFEDFQRYTKQAKEAEKASGKDRTSWYREYLTDIAHDVTSLKKDFDKRLAKALASKKVSLAESVLRSNDPLDNLQLNPNKNFMIGEGNAFLGARAKAIEEDLEEFEFNGKIYPVVKSKKKVNEEYIEVMNLPVMDEHLDAIAELWNDWKNGPMTEPSDIKPAQKELKGFIESWLKKTIK